MTELKPCPFCGAEAAAVIYNGTGDRVNRIYANVWAACRCMVTHAREVPLRPELGITEELARQNAIAAWNTRAEPKLPEQPDGISDEKLLDLMQQGYRKHMQNWDTCRDDSMKEVLEAIRPYLKRESCVVAKILALSGELDNRSDEQKSLSRKAKNKTDARDHGMISGAFKEAASMVRSLITQIEDREGA